MIGDIPAEVGGNFSSGLAQVVYQLAIRADDDIELYTYATNAHDNKAKKNSSYPNQFRGYSINPLGIGLNLIFSPVQTLRAWRFYLDKCHSNPFRMAFLQYNFNRMIKIIKPDLIHVHSVFWMAPLYFANQKYKIPTVLTCHGVFYRGEETDHKGKDISSTASLADYVTGLTSENYKEIQSYLHIPIEKVQIIPNGVDTDRFYYSPSARAEIRKIMGADDDTKVFITVASIQPRKGQFDFVKVIEKLDIEYQYWIVGDGSEYEVIKRYIDANNLNNKIKLLGYIRNEELFKYYSAADLYAHVSTKEGQALCELEAYATGIRTVVRKEIMGTVSTYVDNPDNYYILDFNHIEYDNLKRWINVSPVEPRHSRNALNWRWIAKQYANVYRKALMRV